MSEGFARVIAAHREAVPAGPQDDVFPSRSLISGPSVSSPVPCDVRRARIRPSTTCGTFGVHAVMAGVALPRDQKILGHKTPAMTLRYAQHAPEPHAQDDAAKIAASMAGVADREARALQELRKAVGA